VGLESQNSKATTFLKGSEGGHPHTMSNATKALLERRPILLLWVDPTTSKKKRAELEHREPALVAHFKKVLEMQEHCERLTKYSSCVRCCVSTTCTLCRDAPRVTSWYPGGPALKPVPPAMHDPDRLGHYLAPEAALMKFAADNYKIAEADRVAPSEKALAIYERVMGSSTMPFPTAELEGAAKEINDCRITVDVLRTHFNKLRYIRLRVLEGRRKAVLTRAKNKEARKEAAGLSKAEKAAAKKAEKAAAKKVAAEKAAAVEATAEEATAEEAAVPAVTAVTAVTAAAKKAEKAAAKKVAAEKAAAGAAEPEEEEEEEEEDSDDEEEAAAEQLAAAPASRVGQTMEAQQCIADECDFMCGKCSWESCQVIADDGCGKCSVKFDDGEVCDRMLYRFLRMPPHGSKRKR